MAILFPMPVMQFFSDGGIPLAGGKLYTYEAGTTTPLATYTDETGGTANPNPVILDSAGRAAIWLSTSNLYFMELKNSSDVQIWTADNVGSLAVSADVVGPASSTNNAVVRFDGTTGKLIQNSAVIVSDGGAITATSLALNTPLPILSGGTGANSDSGARANLGLGVLATKGDGDYGDITVSSSGATWTIDADAVTRTKIVNAAINGAKLSGAQGGDAPVFGARAWCSFQASTAAVEAGGNVSSVVDNGGALFTVNFSVYMTDTYYAVSGIFENASGAPAVVVYLQTRSLGSVDLLYVQSDYDPQGPAAACVIIHR